MNANALPRLSRAVALVHGVGVLGLMIWAGDPGQPIWYLSVIPFLIWALGPAWVGWRLTAAAAGPRSGLALLILQGAGLLASFYFYGLAFFVHIDAQSAFIFLFVPAYHYAVLAVCAVALVILRRARPSA